MYCGDLCSTHMQWLWGSYIPAGTFLLTSQWCILILYFVFSYFYPFIFSKLKKKQKEASVSDLLLSLCLALQVEESVFRVGVMPWFVIDNWKHATFHFGEDMNKRHMDIITPFKWIPSKKMMNGIPRWSDLSLLKVFRNWETHFTEI